MLCQKFFVFQISNSIYLKFNKFYDYFHHKNFYTNPNYLKMIFQPNHTHLILLRQFLY